MGDWHGVLALVVLSLLVFDGIGDAVGAFVGSPVFGILLVAAGSWIGFAAPVGEGDSSALVERILGPLRTPTTATPDTDSVLRYRAD